MRTRAKNLKEVAEELKISVYKAKQLDQKIKDHYYGVPFFMIHGTNGHKYNIDTFKRAMSNTLL